MISELSTYDAQLLLFALAFRISCVIQRVPSPFALGTRIAEQTYAGVNLLRFIAILLDSYNAIPPREIIQLPAYFHFQVVGAISLQLRAFANMRMQGGDWFKEEERSTHAAVRRIHDEIGGSAAHDGRTTHTSGGPT